MTALDLVRRLDPRFDECIAPAERIELVCADQRFAEGPVHIPAHGLLYWSDIPNDRVLRFDERSQEVSVVEAGMGRFANGQTVDREGRRIVCEHGSRSVVRIESDGSRTVLADSYRGRRLNSPNDVTVAPDGAVWFTDPTYGIDSDEEGFPATPELPFRGVYRLDPESLEPEVRVHDLGQPNGIAFAPDGGTLYVSDSAYTHGPDGARCIWSWSTRSAAGLAERRVFAECDDGVFDGLRADSDGRVWAASGDGVRCYASDGVHLGTILTPDLVGNVEFGGPHGDVLYICASDALFRVRLRTTGARRIRSAR